MMAQLRQRHADGWLPKRLRREGRTVDVNVISVTQKKEAA
jgi:hypothetical protein